MTRGTPRRRLPRTRRFLLAVRFGWMGLVRDARFLRSRRHLTVPDRPALFVYGHSYVMPEAVPPPWPGFVAAELGLPLVNRAVGQDLVRQTALRARVVDGRPGTGDLVLVHIGLGDVMRRGAHPDLPERFGATLRDIVRRLSCHGAEVHVLAEATLQRWDHHPPLHNGSDEVNAAVHAQAMAIPGAIDLVPGWDPAAMLLPDHVHPNELGVATITRNVLAAIAPGRGDAD